MADTDASPLCPQCGRPLPLNAPQGFCPRCLGALFGAPIESAGEMSSDSSSSAETSLNVPPARRMTRRFGNYELLGQIAEGGMGIVYLAHQINPSRTVALKVIRSGGLATPSEIQRFKREAEAAATLDHPNIVPIYAVGEH